MQPRIQQADNGEVVTNLYVVLKQKVPVETWETDPAPICSTSSFGVDEKLVTRAGSRHFYRVLRQKAIFDRDDQERVYPNQTLAAHVLAMWEPRKAIWTAARSCETVGKDGIERTLQRSKLAGVPGLAADRDGLASGSWCGPRNRMWSRAMV